MAVAADADDADADDDAVGLSRHWSWSSSWFRLLLLRPEQLQQRVSLSHLARQLVPSPFFSLLSAPPLRCTTWRPASTSSLNRFLPAAADSASDSASPEATCNNNLTMLSIGGEKQFS